MSQTTPQLALPVIMPAQAQKHVTHNEALELLDLIVQLTLQSAQAAVAPASPAEGQSWGVAASATGLWNGQGGRIASWRGGGWMFVTPRDGWLAWCLDDSTLRVRSGGTWQVLATPAA